VEVDKNANLISYEEYFPYGGTSLIAGNNKKEVKLKEYRYSGKEKDNATGLYYYGARYYAPWMGRWLSADPAGTVDGLNLYGFVGGNPMTMVDPNGKSPYSIHSKLRRGTKSYASFNQGEKQMGGHCRSICTYWLKSTLEEPERGPKDSVDDFVRQREGIESMQRMGRAAIEAYEEKMELKGHLLNDLTSLGVEEKRLRAEHRIESRTSHRSNQGAASLGYMFAQHQKYSERLASFDSSQSKILRDIHALEKELEIPPSPEYSDLEKVGMRDQSAPHVSPVPLDDFQVPRPEHFTGFLVVIEQEQKKVKQRAARTGENDPSHAIACVQFPGSGGYRLLDPNYGEYRYKTIDALRTAVKRLTTEVYPHYTQVRTIPVRKISE